MANVVPVIQRSEKVQEVSTPEFQSSTQALAESQNTLSAIGVTVANAASKQMAVQLGSQEGKNPHGELSPSITEFDKNFADSYQTQSSAVLGVQAQKLITDANMTLASAPRLNPGMIAKSQNEVSQGLNKIYSLAPNAIRPQLQGQYDAVMIQQNANLNKRMLDEQKEDRQNNTKEITKVNFQNAFTLSLNGVGLDKNGDSRPGLLAVQNTEKTYKAALASYETTPLEAKAAVDSARQYYLSGKYTRLALMAEKDGKLGEYMKSLAEKPPADVNDTDHSAVYGNVLNYMQQQKTLRSEDEAIKTQDMNNRIAKDPINITQSDWAEYEASVSPLQAKKTQFNLIQAFKTKKQEGLGVAHLSQNYTDPTAHANSSAQIRNAAFNQKVQFLQDKNPGISRDEAEVQTAMSAGAEVPVFTQTLKNKLWSGNPANMDSAVLQINELKSLHSGHALIGLSDQDNALYSQYEALRNPADPTVGSRLVIENSQNLDPAVLKVTQTKWQSLVDNNTRLAKVDVDDWVLHKFGFNKGFSVLSPFSPRPSFDNPFMSTHYAADILNKYKTFYETTRGNDAVATKMTQEYVDNNYGETAINGEKTWTLHPIEKTLGFKSGEGIPVIHQDIIRQLEPSLASLKQSYDNKASNEYWTIEQPKEAGGAIQMIKHERAELGTTTKAYPMSLIGNNFNKWDVNIQTQYGPKNLFLESPMLGITTYSPDRNWIQKEYMNPANPAKNSSGNSFLGKAVSAVGDFLISPAEADTAHINQAGIDLIKKNEKFVPEAYKKKGDKLTIGYGSTTNVKEGMVIDEAEAERRLKEHLKKEVEPIIRKKIKVDLTPNQHAAMASVVYVAGHIPAKLVENLNDGDYSTFQEDMKDYYKNVVKENPEKKRFLKGWLKRTKEDAKLFHKR